MAAHLCGFVAMATALSLASSAEVELRYRNGYVTGIAAGTRFDQDVSDTFEVSDTSCAVSPRAARRPGA
jgi:hypothetical protein